MLLALAFLACASTTAPADSELPPERDFAGWDLHDPGETIDIEDGYPLILCCGRLDAGDGCGPAISWLAGLTALTVECEHGAESVAVRWM